MPNFASYYGSWKGLIIDLIVSFGAMSREELQSVSALYPFQLRQALSELEKNGDIWKNSRGKYRIPPRLYKSCKKFFENKENQLYKKPLRILIAHDNYTPLHTTKAHKFANRLNNDERFEAKYDDMVWDKDERLTPSENNKIERNLVEWSDIVLRIVPASSKTRQSRNEGALREVRKAKSFNKPIIEIYECGSRRSTIRPKEDFNSLKRVEVYLEPYETLEYGLEIGLLKLEKKGFINSY